jgi:hypothetical protein
MKEFTGWEYLLIDVANQYGLDKETFEKRIEWANAHLNDLEALADKASNKPLYIKAILAIRRAQKGLPIGHLVGLDASCSGIQIMSVVTGCHAGAKATGLIDPNVRADAYTACTQVMNQILKKTTGGLIQVTRADAKQALMTTFYGSTAQPKAIFGDGTPELAAFYEAARQLAPGAWELLQDLLASWRPFAKLHAWQLPDGFEAKVKVMQKVQARIYVDELDRASFTYEFYVNEGTEKGKSIAANAVHSIDAYVVRSIHRRCNYNAKTVRNTIRLLMRTLQERKDLGVQPTTPTGRIAYYIKLWERSGIADVVILPHLKEDNVQQLPTQLAKELLEIVEGMLAYKPFEVVTIHDEFKCHPNHMNHLRRQYRNVLRALARSRILDMILTEIHGKPVQYQKLSHNLDQAIVSNYGLC